MPDLPHSPYLAASRTWHEARRDELRAMVRRLRSELPRLEPGKDEDDVMRWPRLGLLDVISDIEGQIARLTDEIGDEVEHGRFMGGASR